MPTGEPSVPRLLPAPRPSGLLTAPRSVSLNSPVWRSRPCVVYTGDAINCVSASMRGLNLPLQCCLLCVPPDSPGCSCLRLQGGQVGRAPGTHPRFPPSLVLLMLSPLPGMLSPQFMGILRSTHPSKALLKRRFLPEVGCPLHLQIWNKLHISLNFCRAFPLSPPVFRSQLF